MTKGALKQRNPKQHSVAPRFLSQNTSASQHENSVTKPDNAVNITTSTSNVGMKRKEQMAVLRSKKPESKKRDFTLHRCHLEDFSIYDKLAKRFPLPPPKFLPPKTTDEKVMETWRSTYGVMNPKVLERVSMNLVRPMDAPVQLPVVVVKGEIVGLLMACDEIDLADCNLNPVKKGDKNSKYAKHPHSRQLILALECTELGMPYKEEVFSAATPLLQCQQANTEGPGNIVCIENGRYMREIRINMASGKGYLNPKGFTSLHMDVLLQYSDPNCVRRYKIVHSRDRVDEIVNYLGPDGKQKLIQFNIRHRPWTYKPPPEWLQQWPYIIPIEKPHDGTTSRLLDKLYDHDDLISRSIARLEYDRLTLERPDYDEERDLADKLHALALGNNKNKNKKTRKHKRSREQEDEADDNNDDDDDNDDDDEDEEEYDDDNNDDDDEEEEQEEEQEEEEGNKNRKKRIKKKKRRKTEMGKTEEQEDADDEEERNNEEENKRRKKKNKKSIKKQKEEEEANNETKKNKKNNGKKKSDKEQMDSEDDDNEEEDCLEKSADDNDNDNENKKNEEGTKRRLKKTIVKSKQKQRTKKWSSK